MSTSNPISTKPSKPKDIPATTLMRNEIHELEEVLKASRQEEDSARERMELTLLENSNLAKDRAAQWEEAKRRLEAVKADRNTFAEALEEARRETKKMEAEVEMLKQTAQLEQDALKQLVPECPPPTGQVTIVFTDIEDSTNHWEWNYDVMKVALEIHNEVMRAQCLLLRGYEVRTEGDAFMIAFQDPMDAVQWCLNVQLSLLHADWPEKLFEFPASKIVRNQDGQLLFRGCRVRMGAHTGTPEMEIDPHTGRAGYFGSMAHRAHNVGAAGHGGQTLVSGLTWNLIKDRLNELGNPAVTDMGMHRLPEMATDEHLLSFVPIEVRERRFPIPRSARPPTSLILAYIKDLEEQTRALENNFKSSEVKIDAMMMEGTQLVTNIDGIISSFSQWQKQALLLHSSDLAELMTKYSDAKAELEGLWILERNAKRGMDSMDGVLNSVAKQLDIVPKLEARIRNLKAELRGIKVNHQKERRSYIEDIKHISEHINKFKAAYQDTVDLIQEIQTWSNKDQLGLNELSSP